MNSSVNFGFLAGKRCSGTGSVFLGSMASIYENLGDYSVYIGSGSGKRLEGDITTISRNVFVGALSGEIMTDGSRNSFIGYKSAQNLGTGSMNIYIGSIDTVIPAESNRLRILNNTSVTDIPLIYGVFRNGSTNKLAINSEDDTEALTVSGDVKVSEEFHLSSGAWSHTPMFFINGTTVYFHNGRSDQLDQNMGVGQSNPQFKLDVLGGVNADAYRLELFGLDLIDSTNNSLLIGSINSNSPLNNVAVGIAALQTSTGASNTALGQNRLLNITSQTNSSGFGLSLIHI